MKNWHITKIEIEKGNMKQCNDLFGQSSILYEHNTLFDCNNLPVFNIELQHNYSNMTKLYSHIPLTNEIEKTFYDMNYDCKKLSSLNSKSLENGFVALEDKNGNINYCSRNIQMCDKNCVLNNACELGTMRKIAEGGRCS